MLGLPGHEPIAACVQTVRLVGVSDERPIVYDVGVQPSSHAATDFTFLSFRLVTLLSANDMPVTQRSEEPLMHSLLKYASIAAIFALFASPTIADDVKELKTTKGKPIAFDIFVGARSDCSSNPGPQPFPSLREKPSNGAVGMQIVIANVAASDSCPARNIPSLALIYIPSADFVGVDSVQIDVATGNKITTLGFRITVQAPDDR